METQPQNEDLYRSEPGRAEEALAVTGGRIVGGDLSSGPVTVVSVTVLGHVSRPVLRSGARVGDPIYVSGPLGAASRDLRAGGGAVHRRPTAYTGALPTDATAAIDVSDGLVADCSHLAAESGVCLALADVPVAVGATPADALHGGDDYVIVICGGSGGPRWIPIGTCIDGAGVTVDGVAVEPQGWEHAL